MIGNNGDGGKRVASLESLENACMATDRCSWWYRRLHVCSQCYGLIIRIVSSCIRTRSIGWLKEELPVTKQHQQWPDRAAHFHSPRYAGRPIAPSLRKAGSARTTTIMFPPCARPSHHHHCHCHRHITTARLSLSTTRAAGLVASCPANTTRPPPTTHNLWRYAA